MKILIFAAAALIFQLLVFLCAGSILRKIRGKENYSLSSTMLLGYFVYFSLFEILCLVNEFTLAPLSTLSLESAVLMAAIVIAGMICGLPSWGKSLWTLKSRLKMHGFWALILVAAAIASIVFVMLYSDASSDADYYAGMVSTSVYTNTIGRFDPTCGAYLKVFKSRYAFSCYPFHNAVIAQLFKIPPVVQTRTVMSAVNMGMSLIAAYLLGRVLFTGRAAKGGKIRPIDGGLSAQSRRNADRFVLFVLVLHLVSSTIYLPGIFLYTRTYEGKALIVNIVLPCVLALCAAMYRDGRSVMMRDLFWINLAAVCFSASALFSPVLSILAVLPLAVMRKRWNYLTLLFVTSLPVILWAAAYYMNQHRIFVLWAVK